MKPAPFEYFCPDTVEEALNLLAETEDAKLMGGGQSLLPMMNFRVVRPSAVIDISRLIELDYVHPTEGGGIVVGGLTRHRFMETSELVSKRFPIIPSAMRHVAHLAIRNRGTIGGSLAHADPAAEWPMLVVLLDAQLVLRSVKGERKVTASDFFLGALTTALEEDELLVRIEFPGLPSDACSAFDEVARRPGDFAMAAAGVVIQAREGVISHIQIAMMGVGETPLRCREAEAALLGKTINESLLEEVVTKVCADLTPRSDLHASSDFRKHLAGVVLKRVIERAWTDSITKNKSEVSV
jgi:carbon-monoxide dehydrogenase medium subunit